MMVPATTWFIQIIQCPHNIHRKQTEKSQCRPAQPETETSNTPEHCQVIPVKTGRATVCKLWQTETERNCELTAKDIHTGCQENRPGTKRNSSERLNKHHICFMLIKGMFSELNWVITTSLTGPCVWNVKISETNVIFRHNTVILLEKSIDSLVINIWFAALIEINRNITHITVKCLASGSFTELIWITWSAKGHTLLVRSY